jgi:hypothetical protein
MPDNGLKGKTVFITGASSGFGKACADKFAKAGCRLILCARREEKLDEVSLDLKRRFRSDIYAGKLDVRDRESVEFWFTSLPPEWKKIDILVNNAGLALGFEKLQDGNTDDWDTMIDTNIKGLLYVTHFFLQLQAADSQAHIVNIGSIAGTQAYPEGAVYCATKAAVRYISDAIRMEVVDRPIRVTNIQPGFAETEFGIVRFHGDLKQVNNFYKGIKPLEPGDIAEAVMYAVTAPENVQIAEITLMPVNQASASVVHRKNI